MMLLVAALVASAAVCGKKFTRPDRSVADANARLIQTEAEQAPQWLSQTQLAALSERVHANHMPGPGYFDLTDIVESDREAPSSAPLPSKPSQQPLVIETARYLNKRAGEVFLNELTSYHTRFHASDSGRTAVLRVHEYLNQLVQQHGRQSDVSVALFDHGTATPQPSVVVRFRPASSLAEAQSRVICGCHIDSINAKLRETGRSPGANDSGSSVAANLMALEALLRRDFAPQRALEFHFYAAEEVGLIGSNDMANRYCAEGKAVHAMLQLDMNGFDPRGDAFFRVITDHVDPALTAFLRSLIETYGEGLPQRDARYGYAASDHASWTRNGYRACHTKETSTYRDIHTERDDIGNIDFEYVRKFAKISLAFAIELSAELS